MKDYKDTLFIKNTNFEMRGNLVEKSPLFIKAWENIKLYDKLSSRKATEEFILHDGPPYANGNLHLGHALNKILKDIYVRYNTLSGKRISFLLGWDTHGLPIENELQKKSIKLNEIGFEKYLESAKQYALKQVETQNEQFKKFALLTNHNEKYLTLQPEFEANEIKIFHKMLNSNLIFQDLKPVYWSWSSLTALADAEIEYANLESNSIYVFFKLEKENEYFLIWTTTPWTLGANVALAVGENIQYSKIQVNDKKLIIAKKLIQPLENKIGKKIKFISDVLISDYINKNAINPFNNKNSKIVYGHHVTDESGTGIVHIAGGHGIEDYIISKLNFLPIITSIDEKGHLINSEELNGLFYLKAEEMIINNLKDNCLFSEKFMHQTTIDWRTKKPVVYLATKQWFVSIEKIKSDLIKSIKNVNWYPSWGEDRLTNMIQERKEWCISRQRVWGVPIPIIYDENNKPIINIELQANIEKLFFQKGSIGWLNTTIEELLPKSIKFNDKMRKETDILDVWFDSGSSHSYVLKNKQADLYLEGTDQYRGWFNSSLITSQVLNNRAPYKNIVTHGFINDEKGLKMSKSLGNVINPTDIINKYGIDVLRLWVASSDYTDTTKASFSIFDQLANDYRKIRNTLKFLSANLNNFSSNHKIDFNQFTNISKLVLDEIYKSWTECLNNFNSGQFSKVIKKIMTMLTTGLISYYLDFSKDILYIEKDDALIKIESQFVLLQIKLFLSYLLAPFIPVTIEELYWIENPHFNLKESFFETTFPIMQNLNLKETWKEFEELKSLVNKEIENLRNEKMIKRSQETNVNLKIKNKKMYDFLKGENLSRIFLVGKLNIELSDKNECKITTLIGEKCQRCWNTIENENMKNSDICVRCFNILNN